MVMGDKNSKIDMVPIFFFLNDVFLYLAIDTVFHPSGTFKMAWKYLQIFMFKDGVIIFVF